MNAWTRVSTGRQTRVRAHTQSYIFNLCPCVPSCCCQAALDAHTAVDAKGVRRPLNRALAFFPPGTAPSAPPAGAAAAAAAAAAGEGRQPQAEQSGPSEGEGEGGSMDPALLRRALAARRQQVARLTEFRSRRTREIEARRRKTKVRQDRQRWGLLYVYLWRVWIVGRKDGHCLIHWRHTTNLQIMWGY